MKVLKKWIKNFFNVKCNEINEYEKNSKALYMNVFGVADLQICFTVDLQSATPKILVYKVLEFFTFINFVVLLKNFWLIFRKTHISTI